MGDKQVNGNKCNEEVTGCFRFNCELVGGLISAMHTDMAIYIDINVDG